MFKNTNLETVETMAGYTNDKLDIREMSMLSQLIYWELRNDEPDSIEALLQFYQGDRAHEDLMEQASTEAANAISSFLGKMQNDAFDVIDTVFETVTRETKDVSKDVITHTITTIPKIDFLDSDMAYELSGANIDNISHRAIPAEHGDKFAQREVSEIVGRIKETMPEATFVQFTDMIKYLKIDVVGIYDAIVRQVKMRAPALRRVTPLKLPYTYLEAIVGYHIVKSLIKTHADDTRLSEAEYSNYLHLLLTNLTIRYPMAYREITNLLDSSQNNLSYIMTGDLIELTLYAPALEKARGETSLDDTIDNALARIVTSERGSILGVPAEDRYKVFRKNVINSESLKISRRIGTEVAKTFETFINSPKFDTWWSGNQPTNLTPTLRNELLVKMRKRAAIASIGSESDLYNCVIDIVADVLYDNSAVKSFIHDIRILMREDDNTITSAIGAAVDRVIVSFFVDMLKV